MRATDLFPDTADGIEIAFNAILIVAVATPVAIVADSVPTGALTGCIVLIAANIAYWRYRRWPGDTIVTEYGTPYDRD